MTLETSGTATLKNGSVIRFGRPIPCADEGDFVNLNTKHNFTVSHFGMMLGMLHSSLEGGGIHV